MKRLYILAGALFVALLVLVITEARADQKVEPAYVAPQEQASALAVPTPDAPSPVAVLVIVKCGRIIGIVVSDTTGALHPLDVEGIPSAKVKDFLEKFPKKISANVGCKADIDEQNSTI